MYLEKQAADYFRRYHLDFKILGRVFGENPSRVPGRNMEFEQYRRYVPGENIRDIDWKVYGRSDRLFIKNFGSDLNTRVRIILDASASMNYKNKGETALRSCALLVYILRSQHCRVSFSSLNEKFHDYGTVDDRSVENILSGIKWKGVANPDKIPETREEVSFFISDFWNLRNTKVPRDKNLHTLLILTSDEINLSLRGFNDVVDLENGETIRVSIPDIRKEYQKRMSVKINDLKNLYHQSALIFGVIEASRYYYISMKNILDGMEKRGGRV